MYSSSDEKQQENKNTDKARTIKTAPSDEKTPSSTPANGGLIAATTVAAGATSALAVGALMNTNKSDKDKADSPDINNKDLLVTNNLTAAEIKNELEAAEQEHKKSLSVETKKTHNPLSKFARFFTLKSADSPSTKSYNPQTEASPASESGYNTDPGPNEQKSGVLKLQWDSPKDATSSRTVDKTVGSGDTGVTSAEERILQLTGGRVSRTKQNKSTSGGISTGTEDTGTTSGGERFAQLTATAAAGAAVGAGIAAMAGKEQNKEEETPSDRKGRRASMTPGAADGTAEYQNDAATMGSLSAGSKGSLSFSRGKGHPLSSTEKAELIDSLKSDTDSEDSPSSEAKRRRHAKSTTGDGTKSYQNETMGEWSIEGDGDEPSLESKSSSGGLRRRKMFGRRKSSSSLKPPKSPKASMDAVDTPKSAATNTSTISGLSQNSPSANSEASASKQLISDLLWLEQKIAKTNQAVASSPEKGQKTEAKEGEAANGEIGPTDSMSFASGDGMISTDGESSLDRSDSKPTSPRSFDESTFSSIVCRDCYAPPGKLKIVIHSTKDGPAVHTVKKGSTLEGHIFPGDLIISVDNVDTRSYSAEQVMKMMTAKTRFERKITVLHFEEIAKVDEKSD